MGKIKEIKWPSKPILTCDCCHKPTCWLSVEGNCFNCTKEGAKRKRVIIVTAIDNLKDNLDEEDQFSFRR